MAITIDTSAVLNTAETIERNNADIENKRADTAQAIRKMQQYWKGNAADACHNKYNNIEKKYSDERCSIIEDYVSFLRKQVDANYEITERGVLKAADAFK